MEDSIALTPLSLNAATPAGERAFLDSYQKAFEAGDAKRLESFLHTAGSRVRRWSSSR